MIDFDEYRSMDATAMANAIASGQCTSLELIECAIARAESINPQINAVIKPLFERARKQKTDSSSVFSGVPFLLKDLLTDIKGETTSSGSYSGKLSVATQTATLVERFEKIGLVPVGKTNTPEFGLLATTEPLAFGVTRNPWNQYHTAGGSSGGSAAAVAAGIAPLASAGDGGGSIRIPASCCGLFGFKPTRGVNPIGPLGESWDGAVSEHVITRSVRDSIAVLKGTMGCDAYSHTPTLLPPDFLEGAETPIDRPLKIGFSFVNPYGGTVSTDVIKAVEDAAHLLSELGHSVEPAAPNLDGEQLLKCYSDIYLAHVNACVQTLIHQHGSKTIKKNIEPLTQLLYEVGKSFSAGDFVNSKAQWPLINKTMVDFHSQYDVWMTPVIAVAPPKIGEMVSSKLESLAIKMVNSARLGKLFKPKHVYDLSRPMLQQVPFTQVANLTGQPAMSVPLYWNSANLPIGIQFVGKRLHEKELFQLASQLEKARPWFERVPEL